MSGITKLEAETATGAREGAAPAGRGARIRPETIALVILLLGVGLGFALWAEWGVLIALQTMVSYCF